MSGLTFVIPAYKIFDDIKQRFGADPLLSAKQAQIDYYPVVMDSINDGLNKSKECTSAGSIYQEVSQEITQINNDLSIHRNQRSRPTLMASLPFLTPHSIRLVGPITCHDVASEGLLQALVEVNDTDRKPVYEALSYSWAGKSNLLSCSGTVLTNLLSSDSVISLS